MNKNVMALAVAGVLAAPAAFAQSSNVQLYGRANIGFDNYRAEGASGGTLNNGVSAGAGTDFKSRNRIFDNSSRVGLRGTEDLGNGLKAIFQIETGVNIDSGNNIGQTGSVANASSGFWASRDSFAGIDSNFGRVTFGRQSIFWANGVNAQFAANYINREVPWADGSQLGRITRGTAGASSITRVSNVVAYTSPTLYGLNATVSYSPGVQEAVQANVPGGSDTDGRVWGATLRGEWGPWYGQLDWVDNKNNTPLAPAVTTQAELEAWKAGASFAYMPGARVGVIYVRTKSNNAQGLAVGDWVKQDAWSVNWEHTFGNVQALAQYGWMGQMKDCDGTVAAGIISCDDTKAKSWMVGARYLLSKRTWLYASYNEVKNKSNQFVDYQGASISSVANPSSNGVLGADPRIWALGLFHAF
jgi:predicted porin